MIHVHTEEQIMSDISLTGRPGINQFTAKWSRRPVFRRQREISVQLTTEARDWMWLQPQNWKTPAPWKKSYIKPRQYIKKQRHYSANKGLYSQSCSFSSSHVCMWELDQKEGWVPKNWCSWTVVLKKTLGSPFDSKKIKPVNPKGNQHWIFTQEGLLLKLQQSMGSQRVRHDRSGLACMQSEMHISGVVTYAPGT